MDKNNLVKTLKFLKEKAKSRNFKQSIDVIFNFKDLDLKKADNQVDFFVNLHYGRGKKVKVCAFIGPELAAEAKNVCDEAVLVDDFVKYQKDKKLVKKLANECDVFIAQANIMGQVAGAFGRVLGPKGKMPNPKAGCVVPPKATLKPLKERLQKIVKVTAKTSPSFKCGVGTEEMPEEEVADNVLTLYNNLIHHLPKETANIRSILLKLTMGKPIKIDDKGNIIAVKGEEEPKEEVKKPKVEVKKKGVKETPKEEEVKEEKKEEPKAEEKPKEEKPKEEPKEEKKEEPKEK